jgi:hypothetical protein
MCGERFGKEAGMNGRWLAVIALVLVVALGCSPNRRRSDAYQELLDAEKRFLEDQLYKLDYEIDVLKEKHDSTLRENEALRRALAESRDGGDSPNGAGGGSTIRPRLDGDITPPQIDLGEPTAPGINLPPITPPSELEPDLPMGDAPMPPAAPGLDNPAGHDEPADPLITQIHLHPLLTGGADFDGKPGDDGVSVVIEPRNGIDEFVPVAGPISLVVLDPEKQGEAARVARWDFTAHEARDLMTRSVFGRGIHLQLPWPGEAPENSRLRLFVRYTAPDGTHLEAEREFFAEPPGRVARHWTPLAPSGGEVDLASHIPIHPGAAEPRPAVAPPRIAKQPPSAGQISDEPARPQWRPYR